MNNASESTQVELAKQTQWEWDRCLVLAVAEAYVKVKDLPVLCAVDFDPAPVTHSRRWSPDSCHFCVDVGHAVRDALKNQPDAVELEAAWERLLEDSTVVKKTGAKLITRLARVFDARGLHPARYFKTIRRGSPNKRTA